MGNDFLKNVLSMGYSSFVETGVLEVNRCTPYPSLPRR